MNILLLTHRVPYPPNRGDRIRAYHLLRYLSSRHEVSLACLADEEYTPSTYSVLSEMTTRLEIIRQGKLKRWGQAILRFFAGGTATSGLFHESKLTDVLEKWNSETEFDCIVAFCSSMAPYAFDLGRKDLPVLVDLVDVDSQKWLDYASQSRGLKSFLYRVEGNRLRKFEQEISSRAEAVVLVSESEAEIYRDLCAEDRTHAIINGVDSEYFSGSSEPTANEPFSCVFVGALDYGANIDALRWFCAEVWPLVIQEVPQAKLTVVGRRPSSVVKKLSELPGVNIAADVTDVRPYLVDAEVAIAPLRIARGIQNKVLEAMAMGKPVLATPEALTGIQLQPDVHAVQARTPEQWRAALKDLWDSSEARSQLGLAAREFVLKHHVWDATLSQWDQLLENGKVQDRSTRVVASQGLSKV